MNGDSVRAHFDDFEPVFIQGKIKGPRNAIVLSIFHSKDLYTITALNPKERLPALEPFAMSGWPQNPYAQMGNYPNASAVPLFDSSSLVVTAYGINEKNMGEYRFRVLENGKRELVPWREPQLFCGVMLYGRYDADGTPEMKMAYLGEFGVPVGNSLTVEVKDLLKPDTVVAASAVWVRRAPSIIGVFGAEDLKSLIQVYKFQWKYDFAKPNGGTYYGDIGLRPVDSLLRIDSVFDHRHNNVFLYLRDKVKAAELVEYNLVKDGDSSGWQANTFDPNLVWLQGLGPGDYSLLLRYAFQRQTVNVFRFRVKKAWYQGVLFKVGVVAVLFLFVGLLYSFFKSRNQQNLLRQQKLKRQQAEMGLRSIRSQFNPHFVYNALNSILGLIRKEDTENADRYLSDFSTLMQESLRWGNKEMISIDKELKMLESYIELEKLRFGFNYTITVSDKINVHATELPILLLQPLIENAVKHGISGMYEQGLLGILIDARDNDLVIEIADNGKGFDPGAVSGGYGISLTRGRMQLLSELNPGQPVSLTIESGPGGTKTIVLFKNWMI